MMFAMSLRGLFGLVFDLKNIVFDLKNIVVKSRLKKTVENLLIHLGGQIKCPM